MFSTSLHFLVNGPRAMEKLNSSKYYSASFPWPRVVT